MRHNRIQDQIAIVGVGATGYTRDSGRTARSLAVEAALAAISDAGLGRDDIDGVVSSAGMGYWNVPPNAVEMVTTLRLPAVSYFVDGVAVIGSPLIEAANALYAGACETILLYHYNYRTPRNSRKAGSDPFRRHYTSTYDNVPIDNVRYAVAYAAWASRYLHEYGVGRDSFGYVAINGRSNARRNRLAVVQEPITMDDYLAAPMVRDPLCTLDMDYPVDGADAFVLTTVDRARELRDDPVLIHAAVQGLIETAFDEDQLVSFERHGQDVVAPLLWESSERRLEDVDVAFVYDGFSPITLSWLERLGWCDRGEAGAFLQQHWVKEENRVLIDGRIPINSNGGMLSEGGSQGAGLVREAVHQLRGEAGERQIAGAQTALLAIGGIFFNPQAVVLTRDDSR